MTLNTVPDLKVVKIWDEPFSSTAKLRFIQYEGGARQVKFIPITSDMRETMERVARDDYYENRGKEKTDSPTLSSLEEKELRAKFFARAKQVGKSD